MYATSVLDFILLCFCKKVKLVKYWIMVTEYFIILEFWLHVYLYNMIIILDTCKGFNLLFMIGYMQNIH